MPFQLTPFAGTGLTEPLLRALTDHHTHHESPRLERLWRYYRNPMEPMPAGLGGSSGSRGYRLAQERGLPARLSGYVGIDGAARDDRARSRREIVIENDIAWRVQAMVDFMFSRPVRLVSQARDEKTRAQIERVLDDVWERSGGAAMLADIGLLGHVHGHVDLVVRADAPDESNAANGQVRIEVIEPRRGIPLLSPGDYRRLDAYVLHFERESHQMTPGSWLDGSGAKRLTETVTEIFGPHARQVYIDRNDGRGPVLEEESPNLVSPGVPPVVHIQNVSQPFEYSGLSEVEPLIPLQDELNTRLSDRASRVTMQSFKMYLAKGIDGFEKTPVGPGQMWSSDNPDAKIEAFGGDASSPSEESHIDEIREALDKQSSLPPLATGVVRAKIGNLTSENALRLTLQGVLTRTARKRLVYGRGIADACRLILSALDLSGALTTDEADRAVKVDWPDSLPRTQADELAAAKAKVELGIPRERVLTELGEGLGDVGVV